MVRIVPATDHDGLLTFAEGIETTREAFLEYAEHPDHNETRRRIHVHGSGVRTTVHLGACRRVGGAGLMTHTERPEADEERQSYAMRAPPVHVVHDSDTGELSAVLLGELGAAEVAPRSSSAFRTACTSAVGLDALAPTGAATIGIFGSGAQARNHLAAFAQVRAFERARVYSPTRAHREAFAEELAPVVGFDVEAVEDPASVVEGADVVLAATDTSTPVVDGELLEPGQTVISIVGSNVQLVESGTAPSPRREIDDRTVGRADLVVANSVEQAREYRQADLWAPVEGGLLDWDDIVELRAVVAGEHPGRRSDDELVVYKNNAGEGIVDVALATRTWQAVNEAGLGIDVDASHPREG